MRMHSPLWASAALLASIFQIANATGHGGKDIANEQDGRNWLAYGRTYSEQHASPLKEINSDNISRLGLAWSLDLPTTPGSGARSAPFTPGRASSTWSTC
jgi:glucose dehydrogenase